MNNFFHANSLLFFRPRTNRAPKRNFGISQKFIVVVKLTAIFILILSLNAFADANAQKINLSADKASLKTVMSEIRKQSGFAFIYQDRYLKHANPISLTISDKDVVDVLPEIFEGQPFDYHVEGKVITLTPRVLEYPATGIFRLLDYAEVRGRVVDSVGNPLVGATVRVVNSSLSTQTDQYGMFVLRDVSEVATLSVSYVGYITREVKAAPILGNIVMQASETTLEAAEVVLSTGYQTIARERATGAFGTVSYEQLDRPATNIAQRLIGTNAGVQASLDVNGNPTFEIRGFTSLYANASPLVVVDGFPIQGDFNSVNPNDVESVTILKDAAAASIWGARAANGVIVVVTKKGAQGSPVRVDFQAFTRFGAKIDLDYARALASSSETVDYEMMSFNKWSAQENTGAWRTNYGKQWSLATVALSEHHLGFLTAAERDAELARLRTLDNRQQIKDHLLANPVDQQYNLTISGATGRMNNVFSLLYEDRQSNFVNTESKRYMMNWRNTSNLFNWLDFNTSVMLQYTDTHNNGVGLGDIQGMSPYEMLIEQDGSLANIHRYYMPIMERFIPMELFPYPDWTYNPIQEMNNRDINPTALNARVMGGLTLKPIAGLSVDSRIQYESFNTFNRSYYNENTFYVRQTVNQSTAWDEATNDMTLNLPMGGILTQSRAKTEAWIWRNQVSFDRKFNTNHELSAVVGMEVRDIVSETFGNPTTYGYDDETLTRGTFPNGPGGTFYPIQNWLGSNQTFTYTNSFSYGTERFLSMYGNAAYTFLDKYTVSGSIRTDASNLITDDPAYRYAPFWSIGGRWQLGRERFAEDADWLDQLSLRLTYGYNGNVDKSTAFMPLISTGGTPNTYTNEYTATISSYGNPTLRWEKTGTWNIGIDYSLLGGQYFGKIDVYNKYGRDLIAQLSIPAINGTTSQKLNNAEMINRGIELEFGTRQRLRGNEITWTSNLNFSYNYNEITKLFVANYDASSLYPGNTGSYVEGYNANSMWMFEYAGIHNTQPMIYGADGELYDFGAWTPGDGRDFMLNMGTRVAPYTLGFINNFKIHDFNFSFIFTGKFGHVFKQRPFNYPPTWGGRVLPNSRLSEVLNGDPSQIVPLPLNDIEDRYYFWDRFHQYLSYLSANASHIRMQEINLSYQLPVRQWTSWRNSRVTLYAQGNDLFTILFNDVGEDPEYPLGTLNPQRKFTLGIKVGF